MRFQSIANTLNISHGHKFTGLLGIRTQVKSFKLTSMSNSIYPFITALYAVGDTCIIL